MTAALRDGEEMQRADVGSLLPLPGYAGAQLRVVAEGAARLPRVDRPRSLLVIGPTAGIDTGVLAAVLGDPRAPLVAAADVPGWVGALDVVVVLPGGVDDERSAVAAATAVRRGAATVVRGPVTGPVADAAGSALFPAELAVPEVLSAPGRWALLAAVAGASGIGPEPDLFAVADLLDAAAPALHPGAESFLNPAVNLAEYLEGATPLLIGADPLADALLPAGAAVLTELAGVATGVLPSARAVGRPAALSRSAGPRDIFADPFDDPAGQRVQPVLVSTSGPADDSGGPADAAQARSAALLSALRRALPGAYHLDGFAAADGVAPVADGESAPSGTSGATRTLARVMAAGRQLDAAAAFLAVASGRPLPFDHPAGLGRSAGTRWAVRSALSGSRVDPAAGVDEDY
jgi:hypothetical protein